MWLVPWNRRRLRSGIVVLAAGVLGVVSMPQVALAQPIRTAEGCRARVVIPPKRAKCLACVERGGAFAQWDRVIGKCLMPGEPEPPPPPPPPPEPRPEPPAEPPPPVGDIDTPAECHARVGIPEKRAACVACVERGGVFHKWERAAGTCHLAAAERRGLPPDIATVDGCRTRVAVPGKRADCVACVERGGVFMKWETAAGTCHIAEPPPPPEPVAAPHHPNRVETAEGCRVRVANPERRQRCLDCVGRGGFFHKWDRGAGSCTVGEPAPPAPPPPSPGSPEIDSEAECRARVGHPGKRSHCMDCVARGGVFLKWEAAAGTCHMRAAPEPAPPPEPGPPPPAPRIGAAGNEDECNAHVVRGPKRERCLDCVRSGRLFHLHGAGFGRCRRR